uniref:Proline rich 11 n=1 Tax=Sphenodon punctatus TaxID=8508 RepID=A0A8D0HIY8_SPHPU
VLSFEVLKDALFPSRIYLRELHTLRTQLERLEREFSRIQVTLQVSGGSWLLLKRIFCLPKFLMCVCISVAEPQPLPSLASLQLAPPPPPPPPPPPLPPLPPPQAPLLLKRASGIKPLQAAPLKSDVPMQITLKDLLNVKLKKTQSHTGTDKVKTKDASRPRALITISDLQSINLRTKAALPPTRVTNVLITPSKNHLDLRKHLKRVNIQRSPGGTPLTNKENMETGTGLTPIMTQALRRKFQARLLILSARSQMSKGAILLPLVSEI